METGFFKSSKVGRLLGFITEGEKVEELQAKASLANHMEAIVNSRSYQVTFGAFFKNSEQRAYKDFRDKLKNPKTSPDELKIHNAQMEVWEKIQNFIDVTITNGQKATKKLKEVEDVRRKHAG